MYTLKLIPVPNLALYVNFHFHQLLSAVISCCQLLTADDCWYEKSLTEIFMYTLKLILLSNFSSLSWFSFSSTVISCWQLIWKKNWQEFLCTHWSWYLCKISAPYLDFYFHQLLSSVINCWQLLIADDSW